MELGISLLLALLSLLEAARGFTLNVNSVNGTVLFQYNNDNLAWQDRSFNFPESKVDSLKGHLIKPSENVCFSVPSVYLNLSLIAFVEDYDSCSIQAEQDIWNAGYKAMIAFTLSLNDRLTPSTDLPQLLISNVTLRNTLESFLGSNYTYNESVVVEIWDDSAARLKRLFIIFGTMLLAAVILAVVLFCCTFLCRAAIYKWRTRGLTRWQIRRLPRRKYRKSRETTETCSICLEDFKEGQTIRVLPCDHVFHPKCVDEWLLKWNRTCPLCKATIKRRTGARNVEPDETSQLLSEDGTSSTRVSFNEEPSNYGATESTSLTSRPPSNMVSPASVELDQPASSPVPSQNLDYQAPTAGSDGESLSFQTADEEEEMPPNTAGQ